MNNKHIYWSEMVITTPLSIESNNIKDAGDKTTCSPQVFKRVHWLPIFSSPSLIQSKIEFGSLSNL